MKKVQLGVPRVLFLKNLYLRTCGGYGTVC